MEKKCLRCAKHPARYRVYSSWQGRPWNPVVCGKDGCASFHWIQGPGDYNGIEITKVETL